MREDYADSRSRFGNLRVEEDKWSMEQRYKQGKKE